VLLVLDTIIEDRIDQAVMKNNFDMPLAASRRRGQSLLVIYLNRRGRFFSSTRRVRTQVQPVAGAAMVANE
jgi:hypothetical protein